MKKMSDYKHIIHNISPVYDEHSEILILGSFPSVKSRAAGFFYGNPQNRFWKMLSIIFKDSVPDSIPERKAFLLRHKIAVWDVVHSCDIEGSKDSSIKNAKPSDINKILKVSDIRLIITNGKTSDRLYRALLEPAAGRKAICLPSTSPANAAWSLDKLTEKWRKVIMSYEDMTTDPGKSIKPDEKISSNEENILSFIDQSMKKITDTPTRRIYEAVKKIPRGHVATYSRVAALAGNPKMSRAVGNALHKNPDPLNIPCYRVVNSKGELSENFAFGGRDAQKKLLEADGVAVSDYKVDLTKYGF